MIQSPPLASMLPFHHAMQVAAAQVRKIIELLLFLLQNSTYVRQLLIWLRSKPIAV